MTNKEFKSIDDFVEGFTRTGHISKDYKYDGIIFGIDFLYHDNVYRITRDPIGLETELKNKFGKETANIKFFKISNKKYPDVSETDLNSFLGIFEDVYDLLENGKIGEVSLKDIIANENTEILAID